MVEHVGSVQIDEYAHTLARLLRPGGQLLNHGIARLRVGDPEAGPFSERYVFPDAAPLHLSRIQTAIERAGLETHHIEGFRMDYAETLTHWAQRLDDNAAEAERLVGPERIRIWRLYLRAARNNFTSGFTSVYQVRSSRPRYTGFRWSVLCRPRGSSLAWVPHMRFGSACRLPNRPRPICRRKLFQCLCRPSRLSAHLVRARARSPRVG